MSVLGPVVEECEDAEALRADERLGADDRHAHPLRAKLQALLLCRNFGLAVGADTVEKVGLEQRVVVRDSVDGGGGDVHKALDADGLGSNEEVARPHDVRGINILLCVQGQGGGGVDHPGDVLHGPGHGRGIADVANETLDPVTFRVIERRQVERPDVGLALGEEMPDEVDAEETAAAGDEDFLRHEVAPVRLQVRGKNRREGCASKCGMRSEDHGDLDTEIAEGK